MAAFIKKGVDEKFAADKKVMGEEVAHASEMIKAEDKLIDD